MKHGAAPSSGFAMPTTKQRISINLPEDEYTALSVLATKSNLSMAWVGRKAILDFLDRYRDKQIPLAFSVTGDGLERDNQSH